MVCSSVDCGCIRLLAIISAWDGVSICPSLGHQDHSLSAARSSSSSRV